MGNFNGHNRGGIHMISQQLRQHVQDLYKQKPNKIQAWRGKVGTKTTTNEELLMTGSCEKRGNQFSLREKKSTMLPCKVTYLGLHKQHNLDLMS